MTTKTQEVVQHNLVAADSHEKALLQNGDEALEFLRHAQAGEADAIDEKVLVHKIDWMIVPLMFCCYFLQYLDKSLCRLT